VGYTPPLGPDMHLTVTYDHREMNQPSVINYSNFGPLWNFNWMSTVTVAPTITSVGEGTGGSALYLAGWHNGALPPEADRDTNAYIQYSVNYPSSYEVDNKDGSTMVYGLEDTAGVYYLTQIVDPKGKSTTMTYYTGTTRLQYVTDALGQQTTFQYQSDTVGDPGYYLITGVTDPFGRTATFTYSSGELASITDAAGNLSQFTYGSNAASTVYPDSFISKLQTPYGTTCFSYTLSDDGNIRTLTANEPNNAKQMIIGVADANAQWSSVPEPWTLPASQVPSSGNFYNGYMNFRNSFYWDRKAMSMDPGDWQSAHIYHFFHDVDTGPTSEVVEAEKPALENWIWYAYQGEAPDAISLQDGEFNNVTQIGRTLDSGATQLTQYNYNSSGNKTQSIDPLGRTTSINYESNGIDVQNIQQVNGANTDTLAAYTWNSNHEPLTTTDAAGEQTQYSYYSNTQLESVTDPLGETTTFNYTSGYLTSIQGPDPSSLDLTTLGYANGSGSATNNVTSTTNGEGYELKYAYDNLDRVTQITYPNGNSDQYAYTTLDLTQTTDRMGHTTNYTYNGLDQKTSMTDANGDTTQYGWCSCGSLKSITDGNGHVTRWNQDVEGRTISKTYADGTQELTSYEGATDRVHSVKDAKGQLKVYAYNADDSLASVTYVNAQNPTAPVKFGYDPAYRRITSMQDGIGVTSYTYNPVASGGASPGGGRVAQVTGPWSNSTVQYSYDQLGRVLSRAINGVAQSYQYDVLGRINQVNNDVLGTFSYTFQDDSNRVTAISVPNGEQIKYTYLSNEFNRWLSEIQNLQPPNTNVSTFNYSHQADGAVSSWKQKIGTPQTTYTLGYDNTDELTSASATGSNYGYTYDAGGNRLTETINGSTTTATCNAVNEIQQITPAKPGDKTYQWDAEDRLVGIGYTGTGQQTKLSYDGEGRCAQIQELNNGTVTSTRRFLWCGMERCEERDGYDNMTKRFFTQGEEIAGQPYYFLKDHLGSVWEMTDAGRNIRASYKYDFYGRRTKVSGDLDADFGFTGLFYHQLSQLSLAVYREYDPNTGRWLSRDPYRDKFGNSAELALGPNVYQYVSNSPILSTDPLGLWSPLRRGGGWFYPGHCPPQYTGPDRDKQMAPYVVGLLSLVLFAPFAAWDAALADGTAYTADAGAFLPPVAGTGVSQADIDAAIEALDENIAPDEWDFPE
jgi:RHS repeat-associated protein